MEDNIWKFFLEKAPVEDIKKFCETTGYCLVIFNEHEFILKKEYGR